MLVKSLRVPIAHLHLSARPASALRTLNIRYVYELVQKSATDLFGLPNCGEKSLREVKEKLAALGLALEMTLDEESYRAAVVEAVVATRSHRLSTSPGMALRVSDRRPPGHRQS